jgi:hypothetical protein
MKRAVRKRCGFGCVICGLPIYHYHHMTDYELVREHEEDNLTLLCGHHHEETKKPLLPESEVRARNAKPYCLTHQQTAAQLLHYNAMDCLIQIGDMFSFGANLGLTAAGTLPLTIERLPIIQCRVGEGHFLLSLQAFDEREECIVRIVDNELVISPDVWDAEFVANRLTLRAAPGDFLLATRFEPPHKFVIERAKMKCRGYHVEVDGDITVSRGPHSRKMGGLSVTHCTGNFIGLAIGAIPNGWFSCSRCSLPPQ